MLRCKSIPTAKLDVRCELEQPILLRRYDTSNIVGYADVVLSVRAPKLSAGIAPSNGHGEPYLGVDARQYADWTVNWTDFGSFAFDAKNDIRSLGELMRQFKTYREYSPNIPFYAVSPDSRFANEISDEGFGFIKYPDAIITLPKRQPVPNCAAIASPRLVRRFSKAHPTTASLSGLGVVAAKPSCEKHGRQNQ
jgi:hypothetical protein